jgi:hypothetical protein
VDALWVFENVMGEIFSKQTNNRNLLEEKFNLKMLTDEGIEDM